MYHDCDIVTRDIAADDPFDVEQLGEVRHVLETLLEATKTDGAHPPGTMLPVDVSKLFSKCEDNISRMEASLKRRSGQKRVKGPSSSNPQEILTSLASSAVDLTGGNQQYVNIIGRNPTLTMYTKALYWNQCWKFGDLH